jgi:hypothetical protein
MATKRHLSFVVHGQDGLNNRVLASVFAVKLATLVRGLKSADRQANGAVIHDYVISDLRISSAAVALDEVIASLKAPELQSGVGAYSDCVGALTHSDFRKAMQYRATVDSVRLLSKGAGKSFAHAELTVGDDVFRIDDFLEGQATRAKQLLEDEERSVKYFTGTTEASFDGEIQEVDLRGATPRVKLVLTAGDKVEIDSIMPGFSVDEIRAALKTRAWIDGQAVYSGETGLPVRFEIKKVTPIQPPTADFRRWRGSFSPFDIEEWEDA